MVEGANTRTLRAVARTIGARSVTTETDISIISIRSFSSWASAEPLKWIAKDMLSGDTRLAVLLNMDLRPEIFNQRLVNELQSEDIYVHIWSSREMLNLLLTPRVLARTSGTDEFAMDGHLTDAFANGKPEASARWLSHQQRFGSPKSEVEALAEFDQLWARVTRGAGTRFSRPCP